MSKYIVLKFGGSSQCKTGLQLMARKIEEYKLQGYTVIIVVSAIGKTTNHLYSITKYCNTSYTEVYKTHKKMCNDLNIDFSKIEILLEQLMTDINDLKYSHFKDIAQQKIKIISMGEILSSTIAYIFLKSISIIKDIELFATDAFKFNENNPIKAIGKLYFVKVSQEIKTQKYDSVTVAEFKLPKILNHKEFDTNTAPLYMIGAV